MRTALLWASENPFLRNKLPRYSFVRRAVKRFIPGEDSESALREAARLEGQGRGSVLSILGENVRDESEAREAAGEYIQLLQNIAHSGLSTEISLKLTHLGLDLDPALAQSNLEEIVVSAREFEKFVWVDMESSAYTDPTLEIFRKLRARHANLGLCLQSALYRTGDDLESLIGMGPAIRLVKGAYAEPPEVAYPRKADVDANFLRLAERMLGADALDAGIRPSFATHDSRLIEQIRAMAREQGVAAETYEFQMLYGIASALQEKLVQEGCRLLVTIAYGVAWFPWYMRRLAERPANVWFVLKHLVSRG